MRADENISGVVRRKILVIVHLVGDIFRQKLRDNQVSSACIVNINSAQKGLQSFGLPCCLKICPVKSFVIIQARKQVINHGYSHSCKKNQSRQQEKSMLF